jgi:PAS domain S-box-containing protein
MSMSWLNDRRYRTLVGATSAVFFTTKPDGRVVEPQPSWERFTGQRWPSYRSLGWLDAVFKDDLDLSGRVVQEAAATHSTVPLAIRVWHQPSRSFHHVRGQAVPLMDEGGELLEWVVSLEDVHERLLAQRRLEETASRLDAVLQHSPVGLALLDVDLRFMVLNEALARAAGCDADRHRGRKLDSVAPGLAEHLGEHLWRVIRTGDTIDALDLRQVGLRRDGDHRDWLVSCYPIDGPEGDRIGVGVTLVDVTERNALQHLVHEVSERDARDRFRSALDAMLDLVMIARAERDDHGRVVDFRVEHVNASRADMMGRRQAELTGRRLTELYPAFRGSKLFDRYVAVVENHESLTLEELEYADQIEGKAFERVLAMQITPFEDGLIIVAHDVTERRHRRRELERAYEQLAAAQRLAHIGLWEIDLSTGVITFSDELRRIIGLRTDAGEDDIGNAIERFIHEDHRAVVHRLVTEAPRTGEPFVLDVRIVRYDGVVRTVNLYGTTSFDEEGNPQRLWGTMQDVTNQRQAEDELRMAAVRLEREKAVVTSLQEALLPDAPRLDGVDVAVRYLPAGTDTTVGGDWYDVIPLDEERVLLAVGDVAGHGLPAAALMAQLRNALRGVAFAGQPPGAMLATLNALLLGTAPQEMATALCAIYHRRAGILEWASAGHLPPLVHDGRMAALLGDPPGPPLGMPGATFANRRSSLPPGALLVLYTDGLVEERRHSIDEGLSHLREVIDALADRDLADVCDAVTTAMFERRDRRDDVCLLLARPHLVGEGAEPVAVAGQVLLT